MYLFYLGILSVGVKESSRMNNIFTCINLIVVVFILIAGAIKVDFHNWQINPNEVLIAFLLYCIVNKSKRLSLKAS